MTEEMGRDRLFERGLVRHSMLTDAAQFDPQLQFRAAGVRRFPQNIETNGRTLIGVAAEISLVSVAIVKAWRQCLMTFEIEKKGQDFDDPAGDGIAGEGR